ncbi:MAG: hypothetical protein ACI4U2_05750, partial [Christensenellaceae bacterium]
MFDTIWWIVVCALVLLGAGLFGWLGYRRGCVLEGVRLAAIALPMGLALLLARPLALALPTTGIIKYFGEEVLATVVQSEALFAYASELTSAIFSAVVFLALWLIFGGAAYAGYYFFRRRYDVPTGTFEERGKNEAYIVLRGGTEFYGTRAIGLAIGILCGAFVALFGVLMPIRGYAELVRPFTDSGIVQAMATNPVTAVGDGAFRYLTRVKVEGQSVDLVVQSSAAASILEEANALSESGFDEPLSTKWESLDAIEEEINSSPLLQNVAATILQEGAEHFLRGESYFGFAPDWAEGFEPMMEVILEDCAKVQTGTLREDLHRLTTAMRSLIALNRYMQMATDEVTDAELAVPYLELALQGMQSDALALVKEAAKDMIAESKTYFATECMGVFVTEALDQLSNRAWTEEKRKEEMVA